MVRWWAGSGVRLTYHFIQWCAGGRVLVHLSSLHPSFMVSWWMGSGSLIIHPSFMVSWWMGSGSLIIHPSIHPSLVRWWMGCSSLIIHASFMVRVWVGWFVLVHLSSMIHPSGPWLRVVGGVGNGPTARVAFGCCAFSWRLFCGVSEGRREREREDRGMVGCASLSFFFAHGVRRFLTSSNSSSSFFIPSSRVWICATYCYYLLFLGCLSGTFNFTCAEFRRWRTRGGGGRLRWFLAFCSDRVLRPSVSWLCKSLSILESLFASVSCFLPFISDLSAAARVFFFLFFLSVWKKLLANKLESVLVLELFGSGREVVVRCALRSVVSFFFISSPVAAVRYCLVFMWSLFCI